MAETVAKSLFWTFFSRVGSQLAAVLFSVFLARLLTPAEYGMMGILIVISGFVQIIGDAGLTTAIIYFNKTDDRYLSTAFWLQLSLNLFFTVAFYLSSSLIAQFFNVPALEGLAKLMSLNFALQSVGQIQNAILTQKMAFKSIGIITFSATVVSSTIAVILAYMHFGIWALAWQALSNSIALLIFSSFATRWWPKFLFSAQVAGQLLKYGLYLVAHNALNYWMRNGDNLLIGKFLGAGPLGIYNRAYTLMLMPLQNIGNIVGQVMFPTLSKLRDNPEAFRDLYAKNISWIAFIAFPIMGGLSVLSGPILLLLYGEQWRGAVPILQILSLVGLFQCIIFPVGWIFTATGRTKTQFHISIWLTPLFFAAIVIGLRWGIVGVTWGYAVWAVISGITNIVIAGGIIGLSIGSYLALIYRKAVATILMMAGVGLSLFFVPLPLLVETVIANIVLGMVIYSFTAFIMREKELGMVLNIVAKRLPKLG